MSINSALLAGVSGLTANSAALSSISQNIANVNTIGYKRNETDFQDLVTSSTSVSTYSSGGVSGVTRELISQQGDPTQTTSNTDLKITGQGFFVVTQKATGNTNTDARSFTRAGSFTPDASGYLKNTAGFYLQGWQADPSTGIITTDPSDLSKVSSINVSSFGGTASSTTTLAVNANLDSNQAINPDEQSGAATPYAATSATNMSSGAVLPDYKVPIPISDSKGGQHALEMDFLKSSTPNQWDVEVRALPTGTDPVTLQPTYDIDTSSTNPNGLISWGTVAFTTDGKLDPTKTTLPTALTFGASLSPAGANPSSGATGAANWISALGISAQTINLNLDQAPGGLTEAASKSVTQSITTNGTSFGNLTKINIDNSGFVSAVYDNGVSRQIAQVAVATFPNADGLKAISGDAYQVSLDSGTFNLKTAGSGGAGVLTSSELEASTVDLSAEFTGLITTQRAYSASSKIITTADQMLQELIAIKQ